MSKKMLIDARHPEETRVALLSGGKVEDFDFESLARKPLRGNIYLARVTRVEPSLQAAFVEYGGNRHGFLAFGEIHPDYYQIPVADRDILRAAEALEVELAEKLAELNDDAIAVDDDDDSGVDEDTSTDDEADEAESRASDGEEGDDDTRTRRRGRRRRGGRGRRSRSRSSDEETASDEDTAEASDDADGDTDNSETVSDDAAVTAEAVDADTAETDASAEGASETDADEVAPDEDTSWHGADEDVLDALPAEDTDDAVADQDEESDEDDTDGPKSIALSAKTDPQLTEALPAEDADDAEATAEADDEEAGDEADADVAADDADGDDEPEATADDDASAEDEVDEAGDDEDEAASDGADEDEARAEPEEPEEPTEEELEAKRRAKEIAELQKRYDEARRERDRLLKNYRIQEVIKRRQIMLVQVVKEERGNKGAALTTYLSLAGRYGVLMPNNARGGGVSRKISNQSDRRRLRKAIADLSVPKGQSLIIRTAGAKRTKAEIKRDYDYLARLWDTIRTETMKSVAPCLIYEEASLIKRAIRDLYDKDTSEILVEGEEGYREAKDFMKMLMPSHAKNVQPYREKEPLFLRHGVERQLDEMYQPTVQLKSGGYLVIQQTEALISVDVNSGKATKERNVEATALKTNSEAAVELARQCRLRDLAGLIVVDFIDMDENRNNRAVEKKFKDALKADRARIQVGSISNFGLLEMSRQRRRSGIVDGTTQLCPTCHGAGNVRSVEMAALRVLRSIEEKALSDRAGHVSAATALDVALYILNQKRAWLQRLEDSYGVTVEIAGDHEKSGDQCDIQTSGKARDVDSLRQSAAVEVGDVTIEPDMGDDTESSPEADAAAAQKDTADAGDDDDQPKRKRRRRRRRKDETRDDEDQATSAEDADTSADGEATGADAKEEASADTEDGDGKKRRRRGRRGGRGRKSSTAADEATDASDQAEAEGGDAAPVEPKAETADAEENAPSVESPQTDGDATETSETDAPADVADTDAALVTAEDSADDSAAEEPEMNEPEPPRRERASIHAPVEDSTADDDNKPKRGGWWQRAFGRDK